MTATEEEKCKRINSIVGNYFRVNTKTLTILARDLYSSNREMKELFASDKTMRSFFRKLNEDGLLSAIPYLMNVDASCIEGRWYFKRLK